MIGGRPATSKRGLATIRDAVRTQLWPLPTVTVVVAVVLGVAVPRIDAHVDAGLPHWVTDLVFTGDADAARTVLEAVSSSLITVTALTFSLTVVTLQLASSQFSPRLLRTFAGDLVVQSTLALLLGTFTFALTSLRSVRSSGDGAVAFVPRIAVTTAFVLAIVSVIALVVFLAHLVAQIRVETMLRNVHTAATETIVSLSMAAPGQAGRPPEVPSTARTITAPDSGFLLSVDQRVLFDTAIESNAVLSLDSYPGTSMVAGTPIGSAWAAQGGRLDDDAAQSVQGGVSQALTAGFERTAVQDVGYGLRQLTDIANKALSPGINDPTTAVHAIGHIAVLLAELSECDLTPTFLCHDDVVRVVAAQISYRELVQCALEQPIRYGAGDPQVVERLVRLIGEVAWNAPEHVRHALRAPLLQLRHIIETGGFTRERRADLAERAELGQARLDGTGS